MRVCVTPICLTDSWLFTFHYTIEKLCQELFGMPTDQRNVRCCHVNQRKLFVNIKLSALYVKILLSGPEECLLSPTALVWSASPGLTAQATVGEVAPLVPAGMY